MRKITTRGRLAAFLGVMALCIAAAVSTTHTDTSARQLGGGWGCDEGCASSCVSYAEAMEAACGNGGGCGGVYQNSLCSCMNSRACGRSCDQAESCPQS